MPLFRLFMSEESNSKQNVPAAQRVGDAVGVEPRKWLVVRVSNNTEKACRDKLLSRGIKAFAATQMETHNWKGHLREVEVVRISTYLFVFVNTEERATIINYPFIKYYLQDRTTTTTDKGMRTDVVIPETEMQRMMDMLGQSELPVQFLPDTFAKNDYVRVRRGSLQGIVGQLFRVDQMGNKKFGVAIHSLGCATIDIPYTELEQITKQEYDAYNEQIRKALRASQGF